MIDPQNKPPEAQSQTGEPSPKCPRCTTVLGWADRAEAREAKALRELEHERRTNAALRADLAAAVFSRDNLRVAIDHLQAQRDQLVLQVTQAEMKASARDKALTEMNHRFQGELAALESTGENTGPIIVTKPKQEQPGAHLEALGGGSDHPQQGDIHRNLKPGNMLHLSPVILGRLKHHHGPSATELHMLGACSACDQLRREESVTSSEVRAAVAAEREDMLKALAEAAGDLNLPLDRPTVRSFAKLFGLYLQGRWGRKP